MNGIDWFVTAFLVVLCLSLARRLTKAQEELRIERRLRKQAEQREERTERSRRQLANVNFALAKKSAMYFDELPTLEIAVHTKAGWQWVTYDN